MYTNITRVRTLSGFDNTTNITDENIKSKIIIASGMIDSAIGYVYSLPLAYRYDNTLQFIGTATSGGTLDIVINGVTYSIIVVNGDTSSILADKLRTACENSTDFATDELGCGSTVLIISRSTSIDKSTAYSEVDITSAPDNFGITTTIGTRATRYPVVLEQITAEIATALLFIDEYGMEAQDTGKDGPTRMDRINETLQKLQGIHESGQSIKLFDEITYTEIGAATQIQAESYPNNTSDTDIDDPTAPKIFINKVF